MEAEVRDLKDLLDEKDEKIDMLSRMHGNSRKQSQGFSATPPRDPARDASGSPKIKEDTFRVSASPLVLGVENSDSYQMGSSSGRAFIGLYPFPAMWDFSHGSICICSAREQLRSWQQLTTWRLGRDIQKETARGWKALPRLQSRGFLTHTRLLSSPATSAQGGAVGRPT